MAQKGKNEKKSLLKNDFSCSIPQRSSQRRRGAAVPGASRGADVKFTERYADPSPVVDFV